MPGFGRLWKPSAPVAPHLFRSSGPAIILAFQTRSWRAVRASDGRHNECCTHL